MVDSIDTGMVAAVPELKSEADTLAWKREYHIRRREAEWKKKQDELLTQKQTAWEVQRLEKQNRLAAAREQARRKRMEERVQKKHQQVDREYRDKCREVQIDQRMEAWEKSQNASIVSKVVEAKEDDDKRKARLQVAKEERNQDMRHECAERAERAKEEAEKNKKREEKIMQKEAERHQREQERVAKIKADEAALRAERVKAFNKKHVRCVLVSSTSSQPGCTNVTAEKQKELDARREACCAEKAKNRNAAVVEYVQKLKDERKEPFRGPTEKAILSGERSIFA